MKLTAERLETLRADIPDGRVSTEIVHFTPIKTLMHEWHCGDCNTGGHDKVMGSAVSASLDRHLTAPRHILNVRAQVLFGRW